jgi:hypothetical protein
MGLTSRPNACRLFNLLKTQVCHGLLHQTIQLTPIILFNDNV